MIKKIFALLLAVIICSMSVFAAEKAPKTEKASKAPAYAKISVKARATTELGAHKAPSPSAEEAKTFAADTEVYVKNVGLCYSEVYVDAKTTAFVLTGSLSFSDESLDGTKLGFITAKGGATLRQKASAKSKALMKLPAGAVFAVLEHSSDEKGFSKIAYKGKIGYVLNTLVSFTDAVDSVGVGEVQDPKNPKRKTTVVLRREDKKANNAIEKIKTGVKVSVLEQGDEYSKVEINGKVGFLMSSFINMDTSLEGGKQAKLEEAVPYEKEDEKADEKTDDKMDGKSEDKKDDKKDNSVVVVEVKPVEKKTEEKKEEPASAPASADEAVELEDSDMVDGDAASAEDDG